MTTSIRRPITRLEAKDILPDGVVLLPHGPAGMFIVWTNPGSTWSADALVADLEAQAAIRGFDLEILKAGAGMGSPCLVQIRLTVVAGQMAESQTEAVEVDAPLNVEVKSAGFRVVCHPVNMAFAPNPKRLLTLCHFVDAGFAFVEPSEQLSGAFVNRLFKEGMLQRNPEDLRQFRPTPGGRVWFRRHFAEVVR